VVQINQEGAIIDMNVKKIKRKCGVRGCKNIDNVYAISKTREMGNSIIICKDCLVDALRSIEGYTEPEKVKKEVKSLFPHPELQVTLSSVADEPKPQEVIDAVAEDVHIVAEDTVTTEDATPKPKTTAKAKNNTSKKR
jgi:hypothetical protein